MKLKQLINGGALAATALTLGSAQAEQNPYDGIVFCKATIVQASDDASAISVTLPYTTTGADGRQYTHWNLGKVAAGGVADSWHSEGGPGKFVAHNNGTIGAYVYLTSSDGSYYSDWYQDNNNHLCAENDFNWENGFRNVFGEVQFWPRPCSSIDVWRRGDRLGLYCLAYSRDVNGKNPTWHMLNRELYVIDYGSMYFEWRDDFSDEYGIGAYMGYLPAGEYMPFDVKFWAPFNNGREGEISAGFTFRVEAASFPLWEHDIEVQ